MRHIVNHKDVDERQQVTGSGRIRVHHSHSREALERLLIMSKAAGTPMNYLMDSLILDGYKRWLEDRAVIKKLEGEKR